MKKIIALVLAAMMVFAFCGCTASLDEETSAKLDAIEAAVSDIEAALADGEAPAEEASETEEAAEEAPATEGGVLIMATNANFPPYEYHENDEIVGIDAEVAAAIAEKLGMTLQIDDMDFSAIISAVTSGKADMGMAGMTVTEERLQSVDFSTSYAKGVQSVIVPEGSEITSVDDLFAGEGWDIGVQESTTGDIYATGDFEDAGIAVIQRYKTGNEAVSALVAGKIDCVIIDNEPAKAYVADNEGLVILDTAYTEEDYAICFAKDSELTEQVNAALEELIADGTVQAIIDKYISA